MPLENLKEIRNIVAVASGKGGVGKSTVACHLALALAKQGSSCGLLDADIYGPSVPMMLGMKGRPEVQDGKVVPAEVMGLKVISMGLLATDDLPVIWRGPMVANILQQFLGQVAWGKLDYLIIDLPPGTGDAQLTLTQQASLSGAVIVTTPQEVALLDARRGLKMFQQVHVPVLGVIENMSYFICDQCNKRHTIFREGGGKRIAQELGIPFLGEIPIDPKIADGGDQGEPVVSQPYLELAKSVATALQQNKNEIPEVRKIDEQTLGITWADGHQSIFNATFLREHCTCAQCQDEWTGERKLLPGQLPAAVSPVTIDPVGQYGLKIKWSDGHSTGIYTYEYLRELCQCDRCKIKEKKEKRKTIAKS